MKRHYEKEIGNLQKKLNNQIAWKANQYVSTEAPFRFGFRNLMSSDLFSLQSLVLAEEGAQAKPKTQGHVQVRRSSF